MKSQFILLIPVLTFLWCGQVLADLTPQEILSQSDLARGGTAGIQWTLDITSNENGKTRHRTLLLKAKENNSLAKFIAPAKVKGRQILMRDRNMWFIKPGLKKPVPISPRQKMMGGASYGDIASTNYAGDYTIEALSEGIAEKEECYVMELIARNKKVTYSKIRYWISKVRHVGVKAEFYTPGGKVLKTATFEYTHRLLINGVERPFISTMQIMDGTIHSNVTTMAYSQIETKNISDAVFNLNLLVR